MQERTGFPSEGLSDRVTGEKDRFTDEKEYDPEGDEGENGDGDAAGEDGEL